MLASLFFRGILIGLVASIPTGAIGMLCIQRTLSKNQKSGFISGLGAATADTIFATIAFFSLTFVTTFIEKHQIIITVISGLCVIAMGLKIFFSNPVVQIRRNRAGKSNLGQDYISVFLLTLANVAFILYYILLLASFGVSHDSIGEMNGWLVIAGVFAGGTLWWFVLTFVVSLFRKKFRPRHLLWINRISGGVIIVLGIALVLLMFIDIPLDGLLEQ